MTKTIEKEYGALTKITVERSVKLTRGRNKDEQTKEEEDFIEVHHFSTTPAMATATIPIRMSKNFQSIGITVGVQLPCYAEELTEGIEKAIQMALERVTQEIPELRVALDKLS